MRPSASFILVSAILTACQATTDPAEVAAPLEGGSLAVTSQSVSVGMRFHEEIIPFLKSGGCPVAPEGICASGRVDPYGAATETVEFGAACGGACDLRTVYLPQGTLVLQEIFSNPACPGAAPSCRKTLSGDLTDTVLSGTGIFEGATGLLVGRVRASGPESEVRLSGTLTLVS